MPYPYNIYPFWIYVYTTDTIHTLCTVHSMYLYRWKDMNTPASMYIPTSVIFHQNLRRLDIEGVDTVVLISKRTHFAG